MYFYVANFRKTTHLHSGPISQITEQSIVLLFNLNTPQYETFNKF